MYPDLHCFLYRNKDKIKENLHVLNVHKYNLWTMLSSIQIEEESGIIHLYYNPSDATNLTPFSQQCRGLILDSLTQTIYTYPPDYIANNLIKTDWPIDNPDSLKYIPNEPLVMIWRNKNGDIKVTGDSHFHTEASKTVAALIETENYKNIVHLNFDTYYHILQLIYKEGVPNIRLAAMRHRINLQLQNDAILKETANAVNFIF